MKLSIQQYQIILILAGAVILALLCSQLGLGDVMKASLEGEKSEDEVWTNLNVEYREGMGEVTAKITVDFHNNKMFVFTTDVGDGDIYTKTHNFTSFDFRLISTEETSAYPAGLPYYHKDNIEVPRGESYEVTFFIVDYPLIEGEPIKMELTARGHDEEDDRSRTLEEKLQFTLEPPIYSEPKETPGFEAVFAIASILFVIHIVKKE